jgi:WD40 repeat protein
MSAAVAVPTAQSLPVKPVEEETVTPGPVGSGDAIFPDEKKTPASLMNSNKAESNGISSGMSPVVGLGDGDVNLDVMVQIPLEPEILVLDRKDVHASTEEKFLYKYGSILFESDPQDVFTDMLVIDDKIHAVTYDARFYRADLQSDGTISSINLQDYYVKYCEEQAKAEDDDIATDGVNDDAKDSSKDQVSVNRLQMTCFDIDGSNVASGCGDGSTALWNYQAQKCVQTWTDHTAKVSSVALLNNSIYSVANDGYFMVRNLEYDRIVHSFINCTCPLSSLAVQDPNTLLVGSWDGSIRLLDLRDRSCQFELRPRDQSPVRCLALYEDSLYCGHGSGSIKSWDLRTKGVLVEDFTGHTDVVNTLQVSRHRLYSGSDDNTIRVFDTVKGTNLDALSGHTDGITSLQLCNDSLVSCGYDGSVREYRISAIESAVEHRKRRLEEGRRMAVELYMKQKEIREKAKKGSKKKGKKGKKGKGKKKK